MTIRLDWDTATRATWQELLGRSRSGLQQGWSYGEALRRGGVRVERGIVRDRDGAAWACAQVVERRLVGPFGAAFLLRGPVWLAGDEGPSPESHHPRRDSQPDSPTDPGVGAREPARHPPAADHHRPRHVLARSRDPVLGSCDVAWPRTGVIA